MDNDWRRSQLSFGDQGLTMTLERGPKGSKKPLKSGEIRTHAAYRYGYFEARMRVPGGPGIVAAAFTYADRKETCAPTRSTSKSLAATRVFLKPRSTRTARPTHKKIRLPFDAADGFHTYGFDWQPDYVALVCRRQDGARGEWRSCSAAWSVHSS